MQITELDASSSYDIVEERWPQECSYFVKGLYITYNCTIKNMSKYSASPDILKIRRMCLFIVTLEKIFNYPYMISPFLLFFVFLGDV